MLAFMEVLVAFDGSCSRCLMTFFYDRCSLHDHTWQFIFLLYSSVRKNMKNYKKWSIHGSTGINRMKFDLTAHLVRYHDCNMRNLHHHHYSYRFHRFLLQFPAILINYCNVLREEEIQVLKIHGKSFIKISQGKFPSQLTFKMHVSAM